MTDNKHGTDLKLEALKDSRIQGVLLEASAVREFLPEVNERIDLLNRIARILGFKRKASLLKKEFS